MAGIYIHIPFCKQACSYCDFYFVTRTGEREPFVEQLVGEIRSYRDSIHAVEPVETVYFGGGTPSLLKADTLERIMGELKRTFDLRPREITMEMNPDDVTLSRLNELKSIGITRASMGIQTFDPDLLRFMNRAHTRDEAIASLEALSSSGFGSHTVDLIYGNPGQSTEALSDDLDLLLKYDPPHVSAYSLTVEPDTRLGRQVKLGRILPPDDDEAADHYDLVVERLAEAGIRQYEVSNFSLPGREAIHNSRYWSHGNYLGMGPGAHSFRWDESGAVRWERKPDLRSYLQIDFESGPDLADPEPLTDLQLAEERIMMGLRTAEGVEEEELSSRYGYRLTDRQRQYLERLRENGLAAESGSAIRLTAVGRRLADSVILDLITAR